MRIIKDLAGYIDEELGDAQKYIKQALCFKKNDFELSQLFYQLSMEEMSHMTRLHGEVEKIISKIKSSEKEIPEGMELCYEILHEREIEWAKEIKIMQDMYRE